MQAGTLNEHIIVQRQTWDTTDYGSQKIEKWTDAYKTRACVKYLSGMRTDENSELFFSHNVQFGIRIYHEIRNLDRIIWNNQKYRILNIQKDKTVQRYLIDTELINE